MIYKKIKYMLDNALEDVADKGELTSSNLEIIEKLICSIKGINDIEDRERNSQEKNSFDSRPSRGYNYEYDYDYDEMSMRSDARGGGGGRSNAQRRDSMGRYTNDHESERNEVIAEMHELKNRISDPHTKQKIEKMINDLRG